MPFDITPLLDKSFLMIYALVTLAIVIKILQIIAKSLPAIKDWAKEMSSIWKDFAQAIKDNATATDKNTEITSTHYQQTMVVLKELEEFNAKFTDHDCNAKEIKEIVNELLDVIQDNNNTEETLTLLRHIINKLEER